MTSSVTHPKHKLTIHEYDDGFVTITGPNGTDKPVMLQLKADQARWLARELEHLR